MLLQPKWAATALTGTTNTAKCMELLHLLQTNNAFFLIVVGIVSLMIGSFLNVVIHRLPIMMERSWREQCEAFLEDDKAEAPQETDKPKAKFGPLENIPVVSYLFLKGKCSSCGQRISVRYPIIEAVTALLSVIVAWQFGFGWQTAAGLALTWAFEHSILMLKVLIPNLVFLI